MENAIRSPEFRSDHLDRSFRKQYDHPARTMRQNKWLHNNPGADHHDQRFLGKDHRPAAVAEKICEL